MPIEPRRAQIRDEILARAVLTLGAVAPYWRLVTFRTLYVTDDVFASDIFNGELPGRVLAGQLMRHGDVPVWTSQLCSGLPLAGQPAEPLGILAFSLLPVAAALDVFVLALLLVAAHGAYGLARRLDASRPGAILAGLAFAGSGYVACQLRHLSIVSTVVWLPIGLVLLDRALARAKDGTAGMPSASETADELRRRMAWVPLFGLVFSQQILSGFPQSAYYCGLAYGAFALFRAQGLGQSAGRVPLGAVLLAALGVAVALAAAAGAVVLLPMAELGSLSDRSQDLGWEWSARWRYWLPNALTFVVPYIHGDISDASYVGGTLFWEDYGYIGLIPLVLAVYASIVEARRPVIRFFAAMTVVAYLLVLGPATPVFRMAYHIVPGMSMFRLPTRFLIIVELGLAILAAVGLSRLGSELRRAARAPAWLPGAIVGGLCVATSVDLLIHQPRQNPMVDARQWLAPPDSVTAIRADSSAPRTYTPHPFRLHEAAFSEARGWTSVEPYFRLRDLLQPNLGGGYWGVPSADCFAGIAPRWHVDVWGDHNRPGILAPLTTIDITAKRFTMDPVLPGVLRAYGVTHLLSAYPVQGATLPLVRREGMAFVYRIDGAARTRFVSAARHVRDDSEAAARLLDVTFDPDREILLNDAPLELGPKFDEVGPAADSSGARVAITREDSRQLVIEVNAPEDGFLLLADTFYPGWTARVDDRPVPIHRANISARGTQVPKGRHVIRFEYEAAAFYRGLRITAAAISVLLAWLGIAVYAGRRPGPLAELRSATG